MSSKSYADEFYSPEAVLCRSDWWELAWEAGVKERRRKEAAKKSKNRKGPTGLERDEPQKDLIELGSKIERINTFNVERARARGWRI
jgi:hypothetical protein